MVLPDPVTYLIVLLEIYVSILNTMTPIVWNGDTAYGWKILLISGNYGESNTSITILRIVY